jgi:type IV pilus assembly protein PilM
VLINIGAEITCLNVLKGGASVFTRDASIGINHFHRTIQRELSLDFSQSEALLKGETVEGKTLNDVLAYRDGFLEELLGEIQRSFDYFRATTESHDITHIYLSGGGALMANLPEYIHESLGIPFDIVQPFQNISIDSKQFNLNHITSIAPMMDVGVGLALRRIRDR